jgi:hypothetical protein
MEKMCTGCGGKATVGKIFDTDTLYLCESCFRDLYPSDSDWFFYGNP